MATGLTLTNNPMKFVARNRQRQPAMADTVSPDVRSRMMAAVRGKDTRPEMILRRELHARGFRYRLHDRRLPGTPDLVFRRYQAVCFVHGCFWHRHAGCRYATMPATRTEFWQAKFDANVTRDRRDCRALLDAGWRVATVWECALKNGGETRVASELARWLRGAERLFEIDSEE